MSGAADNARCARCGQAFCCGANDPAGCWCAELPPLPAQRLSAQLGCLCPECLRAELAAATADAGFTPP